MLGIRIDRESDEMVWAVDSYELLEERPTYKGMSSALMKCYDPLAVRKKEESWKEMVSSDDI